jgi:hypothetical protein
MNEQKRGGKGGNARKQGRWKRKGKKYRLANVIRNKLRKLRKHCVRNPNDQEAASFLRSQEVLAKPLRIQ